MVPDELIASGGFIPPSSAYFEMFAYGDPPRRSRRKRFRMWRRMLVADAREWVALKIAPWLDRDKFL